MFWEYHDALFEDKNWRQFDPENLKRIGSELGLDSEQFDQCIDSGRMETVVQQDSEFSRQLGVRSTPTFAINGQPIQGALPFAQFQSVIEQVLQR